MSTDNHSQKKTANAQKTYTVTADQLPLSCPSDEMLLWNSHPKVYLPIEKTGEAVCEYCGAHYVLKK
ncbi:zinc-finger domain-containing protein [Marinicella sp. W31]|uniref:zinc-finger domain-containing protein n=1 Tax=Marinicella sp. W31 TaxID=3023713 RepID=UPI003756593E